MRLFKKRGYENVTLNGIAVEAGFTKSNLYRSFSSREEIFLSIFSGLFSEWFAPLRPNVESDLKSAVEITAHGLRSIPQQDI